MRGIISTVFSQRFKSNRLLPALHCLSRLRMQVTAHAVTSLAGRDRRPRRTMLALKLGYSVIVDSVGRVLIKPSPAGQ